MNVSPDPVHMRAWRAFLEAHARVTTILSQELEDERDLPLSWYDVLVQLEERPGHRLRMTELAGAVLLSKSGLTRLVDKMCSHGLVVREPDPGDRRGTFVTLTAEGYERLQDAAPVHMRGIVEHFGRYMSDSEAKVMGEALWRVADSTHR
ncbi:MAG: MarR family transcriptional regulator [Dehalococcoidia bacterium]|nr:MarR family transcriptional regulator [Dehalococcoidia bacterium]